ncbi:hypothetical protein FNO01nite_34110 [Flavobacterium noncentrifugens]|nr:hypothetical protein [Flavobacterium noncentrifugens]GEP52739.1 hypothetical protein FNO01nite_34110 [Flavobacterium noncentrifugens]
MRIKIFKILILLFFININGYSQLRNSPKKLKSKEEFIHSATKTDFPKNIDDFNLIEAYSFDKKDENIGVTYEKENTKINIYIYPDKIGNEGRLRNEFLSVYNIAFNKDVDFKNLKIINHKGEKYTCNGIRGISKNSNNENSLLTILECGTWMYKIRITSSELNNQNLIDLESKIINKIDPSRLTGLKLFNLKGAISFSSTAIKDSTMLVSTMAYSFKKCEWLIKNLEEKEKYSGFQDLYIDMHKEALKQFVLYEHKHKYKSSDETKKYLKNLNKIIDSPFLNEFLMEEYKMILIIPENVNLNFEEYHKWKTENNFNFELKHNLSEVRYEI